MLKEAIVINMEYSQEELNLICLCSFEELSYKHKFILLSGLRSSTPDFNKLGPQLIKSMESGVYNKIKSRFFSDSYRKKVVDGLESRGIVCVTYFSQGYPQILKETPFPPIVLYCMGSAALLNTRCFAVVGSRRTLPNVLRECGKISSELTQHFTVVSGMADGADSAAVEGAIESGKVISVLAYGFDYAYPAVNENLIKDVAKRGLLITEHPPYVSPKAYLFPVRNRIIAGLSEGTLVVSAGAKSGAVITAEYAVEYGRQLFAFPYGIGVSSGAGCNLLIKKGGLLTENILDIFLSFGLDFKEPEKVRLSDEEQKLLSLIAESGDAFVADIAEKMDKLPYQLIPLLSALEIKGKIVRLGGNRYSAV